MNSVGLEGIACACSVFNENPYAIKSNEVSSVGCRSADGVVCSPSSNGYTERGVGDIGRSVDICTDIVALYDIAG